MKKQLVYIHGGQAYSKYGVFLEHLRTVPIEDPLGEQVVKRWKHSLKEELFDTHEVYMPSMPNSQNAKYEEWKIWFLRYFQFLRDDVVLMGHSQGGYFLVKYLTENSPPMRVKALYLLGTPFGPDDFGGEDGGDFAFDTKNLSKLTEHVEHIHILHSEDDFVVPFSHAQEFQKALPGADFVFFKDKNHFLLETFPELIEHIKSRGY